MTLETKCQRHWKRLGITDQQTLKTYIQSIFSKHDHQKKSHGGPLQIGFPGLGKDRKNRRLS